MAYPSKPGADRKSTDQRGRGDHQGQSKSNANVKRLKTMPGINEFFARLIDAKIDVALFRSASKVAAYGTSCSRAGKTGIKQGNNRPSSRRRRRPSTAIPN